MDDWKKVDKTAWVKTINGYKATIVKAGRKYFVSYEAGNYITEHTVPFKSLEDAMDFCEETLNVPFIEDDDYD